MPEYAAPQMDGKPSGGCKALYDKLAAEREPYLQRARSISKLTIPRLVPEVGANASTTQPSPFSSVGTRGVNNLASKLIMALFPPNVPFFKFTVDPYALETLLNGVPEKDGVTAQAQVQQNLVKAEEAIQAEIETSAFRVVAHEALTHLPVSGSVLVHWPEDEPHARLFHLDQFVVRRTGFGKAYEIITLEFLAYDELPEELEGLIRGAGKTPGDTSKPIELYTHAKLDASNPKKKVWNVYQECCGQIVPDSEETYTETSFPYLPLRSAHCSGEDYSRPYCEDYLGDLFSMEGLTQSIVEGSAAAARGLMLVNPAGMTDINTLNSKPNWSFVEGRPDDVKALTLEKFADFNVAANTAANIEQRLARAFLLNSAIQRQAERVTAEEIRYMAQELESALGGIYSLLSLEFQLPLVNLLIYRLNKQKRLPKIEKRAIRPTVVTGLDALGRGNDLNRLREAFGSIKEMYSPVVIDQYTNPREGMSRVFTASGVKAEGLVKTEEEVKQLEQAAQMQNAANSKVAPEVVKQLGAAQQAQQAPQGG